MTGAREPQEVVELPAEGCEEIGSTLLREALAARDVAGVGRALRHDVVVVPLFQDPRSPEPQVQVVSTATDDGGTLVELCLFSSAAAFARFVGATPHRSFTLRRGPDLAPFLHAHRDVIDRVTFDPAEPHALSTSPADVLAKLDPQDDDDHVAWLLGTTLPGTGAVRPPERRPLRELFRRPAGRKAP